MHKQCDTALSKPMCTELPNVYSSASCSVDQTSSNMHTLKTALKQKHTHLDKQTQAERKRIRVLTDAFFITFTAFLTNQPISHTTMLYTRLELSHSICFLFFLSTMRPVFLLLCLALPRCKNAITNRVRGDRHNRSLACVLSETRLLTDPENDFNHVVF